MIQGEKIKIRKRLRNIEDSDFDFNCSILNSVDYFLIIVKQFYKRKFRVQKISIYTEYDLEGFNSLEYGFDVQDGRYGVSDGGLGEELLGFVLVLFKFLVKFYKRFMLVNQLILVNLSVEMVNFEGVVKFGMEYQIKLNDGFVIRKEYVI